MKKFLCLLLAAVLAGLLILPCAAAEPTDFTDRSTIRNYNAVRMLADLDLVAGYSDGSFGPDKLIRREEVAKLMALLADADAEAQGQNAPVPFYDVSESWALPFIAYCAQNEIVAGSNGRFRPADHVTLRELAKMLLVLLGEDSARYVGAGWAQNVDQDAFEKGIYAGLTAGYEEDATRDNACLLIYNATLCPKVANASENSVQRYVLDALMNPMSYLEIRFGLTRYTATLTGNECADLTGSSPLPAGTSKLAGHKAFQVSTDLSLLGRSVDIYVKDGKVFGVPCYAVDEIYYTFADASQLKATRDNACLLIYNATLCPKVANASENSVQRYVLDALMNPMSYLEIRFGLTRYTATLTGNECADLTGSSPLPAGTSKLAGHKAFQVSTDLSLLGRSVDIYVKDGKVFGVPCYAVDEIYYTFADASQLKEICQGGGFRLTDETEYYYNYARSSKEILNAVTANDKITVIDHDGDNAFDVVLVTTSRPATVTATSPLTVDVGGQSYEVRAFSQADTFAVGDAVYYSQVCGSGYIRRLNG